MRYARMLPVLFSLILAPGARAAEVPVSYLVDDVALKAAVSGTELTFELYSDSACSSLVHSSAVDIDDVIVLRHKRFKPSGGLKPPKTAELRTTLAGVTAPGHFHLEVSGTGVTAVGGSCQAQAAIGAIPATCNDTIRNQDESDVDCGGENCNRCLIGEDCNGNSDCASQSCSGGTCQPSCYDGIVNQDETATDCGGTICMPCGESQACNTNADCQTSPTLLTCFGSSCTNHCFDGAVNGDETDVNCGGIECDNPCSSGQTCMRPTDCVSSTCTANVCD